MSGYMGFGMQSWLYKKRPRKPFAKRGQVPSFSPLHNYSRTFSLKPHVKKNNLLTGLFTLAILILSAYFVFTYCDRFTDYSNQHRQLVIVQTQKQDEQGFNFLINSGKRRLSNNNVKGAYSEFHLAYNIRPENEELNRLLLETLSILCSEEIKYCDKLDYHLGEKH
jgi:hypothetical protein